MMMLRCNILHNDDFHIMIKGKEVMVMEINFHLEKSRKFMWFLIYNFYTDDSSYIPRR